MGAEVGEAPVALERRMDKLEAAAATVTSEVIRLRGELNAAEERIAAAAGAEAEKAQAAQRIRALETERDGLLGDLAELRASLEALQAAKAQLEAQIDQLHEAAANATDLARQNLLALEDRLRQLKGSLETIEPAGGAPEPAPAPVERSDRRAALESPENGATPQATLTAATGAAVQPAPTPAAPLEGAIDRMKSAHATRDPGADILDALPLEERLHVQGLLADLEGRVDEQGLTTIVPGGLLFAVNSETVQESAYDTLAKVAELISVYDDRKVLIVGHTDAVGDAAYNKHLSQRRAELVKRFFVDNFGVEEDRLATTGFGEERPIASDATPEGRRANRRVEILILN